MTACPACAGEVHAFAARCVHCGAALEPASVPLDAARPGSRAVLALTLSVVGFALLLPVLTVPALALGLAELSAVRAGRAPRPGEVYALWAVGLASVQLAALAVVLAGLAAGGLEWTR